MSEKTETRLARRDPFAIFDALWPSLQWPFERTEPQGWSPTIEVTEKDNRLITKVDLPGVKKEDVKVEVADNRLTISGERKNEIEEKKENFYRSEREYGSFYRAVPLPAGVKAEEVKATFENGVLEVSVPLPVRTRPEARKIEIQEPAKAKNAA
jgi:HSP20 family protein